MFLAKWSLRLKNGKSCTQKATENETENDRKQSKILKRGRPPREAFGNGNGTGSSHGVYQRRPTQQILVTCQPAAESVESSIRHRHRPVIIIIIIIIKLTMTTNGVSSHPRYVDMSIGTFDAGQDASRGGTCVALRLRSPAKCCERRTLHLKHGHKSS